MGFLRLGVACAVRDEQARLLLSKREDLNVWNVPAGRLDEHELLTTAAVREVREETGVEAEITRLVGLYYYQGWQRINVLYEAKAVGGELKQETFETRANKFFAQPELPSDNIDRLMAEDVFNDASSPMRVIKLPADEVRQIKMKLRWRWVRNLLRGHLEPRHPRFNVFGCVRNCDEKQIRINGDTPIWEQLHLTDTHQLRDIRQNTTTNTLHFMFYDTGVTSLHEQE